MFSDMAVRKKILAAFPQLEPWRVIMEDIEYGDKLGLFYRSPNGVKRLTLETKGNNDDALAAGFIEFIKGEPRVLEAKPSDTALGRYLENPHHIENRKIQVDSLTALNYEGRAGRHPLACVCTRCVSKRNG